MPLELSRWCERCGRRVMGFHECSHVHAVHAPVHAKVPTVHVAKEAIAEVTDAKERRRAYKAEHERKRRAAAKEGK